MPEALGAVFATPGLGWLIGAAALAGLVRGFTGFGAALIYAPVAGIFLPPPEVVLTLVVMDLAGVTLLVRRALATAERRDVLILIAGAVALMPVGLSVLSVLPRDAVRWAVASLAAGTLAALVTGLRYRRRVGPLGLGAVGAVTGLVGGSTGLAGPPVILFYLGSEGRAPAVVRANTLLVFAGFGVSMGAALLISGLVDPRALRVCAALVPSYMIGIMAGARAFRPEAVLTYRRVAYAVIAGAIVVGLPIFD